MTVLPPMRTLLSSHLWLLHCVFQSLLADEQVASAPILILGNKIDLAGAASEDDIRHWFGLHNLTTGRVNTWFPMQIKAFKMIELGYETWWKGFNQTCHSFWFFILHKTLIKIFHQGRTTSRNFDFTINQTELFEFQRNMNITPIDPFE